jgi:hypothetical protein
MRLQQFTMAALLFLPCGQSLFAEPQEASSAVELASETINKATETLNDPTVMSEKLEQRLASVLRPTDNSVPLPPVISVNKGELKDPTRMNQNFREALKRVSPGNTGTPTGTVTQGPALPKIKLVASICDMHKDKNHAMLRINDKTEMVSIGDKISSIESNQLVEIHVLEIEKGHVKVEVLPANETIILR